MRIDPQVAQTRTLYQMPRNPSTRTSLTRRVPLAPPVFGRP